MQKICNWFGCLSTIHFDNNLQYVLPILWFTPWMMPSIMKKKKGSHLNVVVPSPQVMGSLRKSWGLLHRSWGLWSYRALINNCFYSPTKCTFTHSHLFSYLSGFGIFSLLSLLASFVFLGVTRKVSILSRKLAQHIVNKFLKTVIIHICVFY